MSDKEACTHEVEDPAITILERVIDILEDDPTKPGAVDFIISELDFVIMQIDNRNRVELESQLIKQQRVNK